MRGTSHIRIGEVAGMRREITVRNVVLWNCGSPGGLAPPGSAGRLALPGFARPPRHAESALFEVSCVENDTTFPHSKQVGSLGIEVLRAVRMWMRGGHVRPSGIVSRKTRCVAGQNYQIVGTGYCGIILSRVIIVILPMHCLMAISQKEAILTATYSALSIRACADAESSGESRRYQSIACVSSKYITCTP